MTTRLEFKLTDLLLIVLIAVQIWTAVNVQRLIVDLGNLGARLPVQ